MFLVKILSDWKSACRGRRLSIAEAEAVGADEDE